MIVGALELEIFIPGSGSLKDKRKVVKSLCDRIRSRFNVSVAEIDFQDKWQRAVLGVSATNSMMSEIEDIFYRIRDIFEEQADCLVTSEKKHFFKTETELT